MVWLGRGAMTHPVLATVQPAAEMHFYTITYLRPNGHLVTLTNKRCLEAHSLKFTQINPCIQSFSIYNS